MSVEYGTPLENVSNFQSLAGHFSKVEQTKLPHPLGRTNRKVEGRLNICHPGNTRTLGGLLILQEGKLDNLESCLSKQFLYDFSAKLRQLLVSTSMVVGQFVVIQTQEMQ